MFEQDPRCCVTGFDARKSVGDAGEETSWTVEGLDKNLQGTGFTRDFGVVKASER
jgi:hypothetical protein